MDLNNIPTLKEYISSGPPIEEDDENISSTTIAPIQTDVTTSNISSTPDSIPSLKEFVNSGPAPTVDVTEKDVEDLNIKEQTEMGIQEPVDPRIFAKFKSERADIELATDAEFSGTLEEMTAREEQAALLETMQFGDPDAPTNMLPRPTNFQYDRIFNLKEERLRQHEETRDAIQLLLNDPNPVRAQSVSQLLDSGMSLNHIAWVVGAAEWTPFYGTALGIIDIPENYKMMKELWSEGNYLGAAGVGALSAAELTASIVGGKAVVKKGSEKLFKPSDTASKIREATEKADIKVKENAAKVAKANTKISKKMIEDFELSIDPTGNTKISKTVNGKLVLDPEKAKEVGLGIASDVYNLQSERMDAFLDASSSVSGSKQKLAQAEQKYGVGANQVFITSEESVEDFVSPLLNPESFNSIVAVTADLQKSYPDAFNNKKTVIENLFDLTVSGKLDGDDLNDTLAKYGLNFDEYVLTVVGSGSEAGKILNKLSQIKRAGSFKVDINSNRQLEKGQNAIMSTWRRIENIRRGSMTSMIKTAARNFESAFIRSPLEALQNVMDTSLLAMSNEYTKKSDQMFIRRALSSTAKGATTFVSPENWKGSMAMLKRIYATPKLSKELTEIILERPEFAEQHKALFEQVNEYRRATGAGTGGAVDKTLSTIEGAVDILSTPNRIQEFVIRRGVYTGEMERLLKRDWGIDMIEVLEKGDIGLLSSNSTKYRPKGARPFEEIVDEATKRALDVTYAKAPDVPLFRDTANFLSRTGLTAVTTPFPRFMFNSIELMGQYTGGAFNPALKRIFGMKKGPLDAKDRQNISRNLSGLVGILAAYQYRTSDGAPADSKMIEGYDTETGEGTMIDTTSQYPLRQALWIAEAMKRLDPETQKYLPVSGPLTMIGAIDEGDGTFEDWFDLKEFTETFLGTSARTGTTSIFVEEIANIVGGSSGDDPTFGQRRDKVLGRLVGDYIRTHLIPLTQVVELQRMVGVRPEEYKDYSTDDPYTFSGQVKRSIEQSGVASILDPSKEAELPSREFVLAEDRKRITGLLSAVGGIAVLQENNEDAEYLIDKGFSEFDLGSRQSGSVRRNENAAMREQIPMIVDMAKTVETDARKTYMNAGQNYKKRYTLQEHINDEVTAVIKTMVGSIRQNLIGDSKYKDAPAYIQEYNKFKNLPRATRKYALREFYRANDGEPPDITSVEDLGVLLAYSKKMGIYRVK